MIELLKLLLVHQVLILVQQLVSSPNLNLYFSYSEVYFGNVALTFLLDAIFHLNIIIIFFIIKKKIV